MYMMLGFVMLTQKREWRCCQTNQTLLPTEVVQSLGRSLHPSLLACTISLVSCFFVFLSFLRFVFLYMCISVFLYFCISVFLDFYIPIFLYFCIIILVYFCTVCFCISVFFSRQYSFKF